MFLRGVLILYPLIIGIRLFSYLSRYNIRTLSSLFSDFILLNILNNLEKVLYLLLLDEGLLIILKRGANMFPVLGEMSLFFFFSFFYWESDIRWINAFRPDNLGLHHVL